MTTSSANNSVFRGFFEKQKLIGPNFIDWYRQLRIVLSIEDKLNYIEQPIPPAPVAPADSVCPASIASASSDYERFSLLQAERRAYLVELLKKKKNATSGADGSGSKGKQETEAEALSLYVDNGQCEAVEAIGAFYLCLPSGLEIVLNNCHYAPSITRGVISVSRFSIHAVSNKRAKLDLDSALLWHYRLGHISKKRIEKLQHYGLLDSSDLRAFKKCVFCMSRKMARKPYTHQVERAKDLLGLIHTDVCGPFKIMSRQGASYFVAFTDDFSRYGYVYLLKHKHEVFENFKVFQKEVENQLDEPQSDIVPIRRSIRTRHAPDRMCLYIDAEEHELGGLGEPANYKAALLDPKSEKWLNAMNVKMQSMKDNEVWVLVELSSNGKTVDSKWLFKKKTDMDGNIHTYKARLVAKGYTQTLWIDYEETFSSVTDIRAIRILIAIAAYYDYEIWQMDVKTAFLNGYLNEEVYMKQPEGESAYIIGIKIYKDRSRRLIGLCQSAYIEKILKRFCMENSKRGSSIMYAVRCTRPDVAFAQNATSRFQQSPGDIHWTTVKNILKYIRNNKDMF
nr:retrotransposon protein, putative, Ty1-copia subclass [Tanacetum cinerariifolium]